MKVRLKINVPKGSLHFLARLPLHFCPLVCYCCCRVKILSQAIVLLAVCRVVKAPCKNVRNWRSLARKLINCGAFNVWISLEECRSKGRFSIIFKYHRGMCVTKGYHYNKSRKANSKKIRFNGRKRGQFNRVTNPKLCTELLTSFQSICTLYHCPLLGGRTDLINLP